MEWEILIFLFVFMIWALSLVWAQKIPKIADFSWSNEKTFLPLVCGVLNLALFSILKLLELWKFSQAFLFVLGNFLTALGVINILVDYFSKSGKNFNR